GPGACDGQGRTPGDRSRSEVWRRPRLHGRHDLEDDPRHPDRDVRAGPPAHPSPDRRVRRGRRGSRCRADLRRLGSEFPQRMSDADAPRLRAIEAVPVEHEGEEYVALRDPAGYTPSVVMLPPALLEVVALFDGAHPIVDIQAELMQRHGELVTREDIEKLVAALDEHGFLDTPAFAARRAAIDRA